MKLARAIACDWVVFGGWFWVVSFRAEMLATASGDHSSPWCQWERWVASLCGTWWCGLSSALIENVLKTFETRSDVKRNHLELCISLNMVRLWTYFGAVSGGIRNMYKHVAYQDDDDSRQYVTLGSAPRIHVLNCVSHAVLEVPLMILNWIGWSFAQLRLSVYGGCFYDSTLAGGRNWN